jgi:hypothetical protein
MKNKLQLISGLIVAALVCASLVIAGTVYDRSVVTISTTLGTATWVNADLPYSAIKLVRIWVEKDLIAINTVTVSRVTSDGVYTQSVGSVVTAANAGSTASFTATYLKQNDYLLFSSTVATGATAIVEYEVQQH